jgi:cytosine permease
MSLIGWYGVISNFLGQAGQQMLLEATGVEIATYIPVVIASLLMIGVTLLGFTGIDKLALYLVPVMISFLIYAAITSLGASTPANSLSGDFTFETAVSAVIGSYIAGVIIQPDYSRFAKSLKVAVWSVFLALGIAFPAVQFLSAIPRLATGNANLMAVMALLGLTLPAFLLLVLGAWSSNVLCLYSAGLSIATVAGKISLRKIISGVGIIGTAIAFAPAQDYLIDFLVVLGVVIPPIGAVYLIDAFLLRRFDYAASHHVGGKAAWVKPKAFIAWGCGSLAGFIVQLGYGQISGISSVDSLLVTALILMLMEYRSILRWSC